MGIFRLKVVQRGTITVDGVDSLEEAEEYLESCNPVDDVKWSGFLEVMQEGIELQKISVPDVMTVREFADRILVKLAEIIKWLFLRGKVATGYKSPIGFDDITLFPCYDESLFYCVLPVGGRKIKISGKVPHYSFPCS